MNPLRETSNLPSDNNGNIEANSSFGPEDLSRFLKSRTPRHTFVKRHHLTTTFHTFSMTNDSESNIYQDSTSESEYISFSNEEEHIEKENDNQLLYSENINFKLPPRLLKRIAEQNKTNKITLPQNKIDKSTLLINDVDEQFSLKKFENIPPKVSTIRRNTVFVRAKNSSFIVRRKASPPPFDSEVIIEKPKVSTTALATINRSEEDERYMNWYNSIVKTNFEIENVVVDFNKLINACVGKSSIPENSLDSSQGQECEARLMKTLRSRSKSFYKDHVYPIKEYLIQDIKNDRFHVRSDKNVHLDVGVQKHVIEILSNYNPLWLFIAAECVFDCQIDLSTNCNPVHVLYHHLVDRLFNFRDLAIKAKCKNTTIFFMKDKNVLHAKRHILANFILLVHFLDSSKSAKIIDHNPALFRIDANFKSSKEIMSQFSRDYITGVGDIFKTLRFVGISLDWQQSKIEEFSFISTNLAADFTCGTRLARLIELIFHIDILRQLQFPVNSISRKLHNIHIVTTLLKKYLPGFPNNFVDKDICNRNREKLLFIFDLLIEYHNYQLKNEFYQQVQESVIKIQRWYRARLACRKDRNNFLNLYKALIFVQQRFRLLQKTKKDRRDFLQLKRATILIQRRWRSLLIMKRDMQHYSVLYQSIINIQQWYRAILKGRLERRVFLEQKDASIKIQMFWRNIQLTRLERRRFIQIKLAALTLQAYARGYFARKCFSRLVERNEAAKIIQKRWRNRQLMLQTRRDYLLKIRSCSYIQKFYLSYRLTKRTREEFLKKRHAAIVFQKNFRRKFSQCQYQRLRQATSVIQLHFRSYLKGRSQRETYLHMKASAIIIQRRYRAYRENIRRTQAAKVIQHRFRATLHMRKERCRYLLLKKITLKIQQLYRAKCFGEFVRKDYLHVRCATIVIQKWYRKCTLGRRFYYVVLAQIGFVNMQATRIQSYFRGYITRKNLDKIDSRYRLNRDALALAYENAPERELFYPSVLKSIDRISKSSTILKMRYDLEKLSRGTCFFPEICIAVLHKNAVFRVILDSMLTFNRSEPHQGLLFFVYTILLNVLQCKKVYTEKLACLNWKELIGISVKNWKAYVKSNRNLTSIIIRVLRLIFEYPATVQFLCGDKPSLEFVISQFRLLFDETTPKNRTPAKNIATVRRQHSFETLQNETYLLYTALKNPLKLTF